MWVPDTTGVPDPASIVPALETPSPQSTVAVAEVTSAPVSVKVATDGCAGEPATAAKSSPVTCRMTGGAGPAWTTTVAVSDPQRPLELHAVTVTPKASLVV